MLKRVIGRTGVVVSAIGLTAATSGRLIDAARGMGITVIADLVGQASSLSPSDRLEACPTIRLLTLGPPIGWREEGIAALMEHRADAVQTIFSIFEQDPGRELCQVARAMRASVLAVPDDTAASPAKWEKLHPYANACGLSPQQFAIRWLLMDDAVASVLITPTSLEQIDEAVAAADAPPIPLDIMRQLADDYAADWGLGPSAHPRDLASSVSPTGKVRSGYVPPPILLAQ